MSEAIGFKINVCAKTDVGLVRSGNEDNFLVLNLSTADTWTPETAGSAAEKLSSFDQGHYGTVIAVTDGMGGALAGEVASRLSVESVRDRMLELQSSPAYSGYPFSERLRLAIELANLHIHYESINHSEYAGMGATFTAVGFFGTTAYFAQIGDSRAYVFRDGAARQATRDQSLVGQLVESGHITLEEAEQHTYKNVILQALGAAPYINVAVSRMNLYDRDTLLLCSDGLSNKVKGEEMINIVAEASSLSEACDYLIQLANNRGGEDNITVMLVQVTNGNLRTVPASAEDQQNAESWEIEAIPRDPTLPHEVDSSLIGNEDITLPEP